MSDDQEPQERTYREELELLWVNAEHAAPQLDGYRDEVLSGTEHVVYRAYYEAMPLGLYTTREAARAHCLADAKSHGDDITDADWWPQDEGDPADSEESLVLKGPKCGDLMTDYSVMPLVVQAAYDPEAEG